MLIMVIIKRVNMVIIKRGFSQHTDHETTELLEY